MHYKYLILSDLHLGSSDSNPKKLLKFLKSINYDILILNGDIIDGWKIKRGGRIRNKEVEVLKHFFDVSKTKTVVYIRGNHDDFLDNIIPIYFGDIHVVDNYTINADNKYHYIIHGDVFDKITKELKWVAVIGDIGYTFLIKTNKIINKIRHFFGLEYYSFSKEIKLKVKKAVNYISDYEENLTKLARQKNCQAIICGHIHHPEIKEINEIMYYNSGDWVESMSSLVYSDKNGWEILYYKKNEE